MDNIIISNQKMPINEKDYQNVCENLRKRIIRILYLKEDLEENNIKESDITGYINALIWDVYGAYLTFDDYRFLNCICEITGIKENICDEFARKKILDVANYIVSIPFKKG